MRRAFDERARLLRHVSGWLQEGHQGAAFGIKPVAMASAIVRFLLGEGRDAAGRTLGKVLAMDNAQLERRHDYVQWLFPLPEASSALPGAPVLSADDVMQIRSSDIAATNLRAAAARMRDFYARTRHWLVPADHNHLRITRIIKSLRLLVNDAEADAFKATILDMVRFSGAKISAKSMDFWASA